MDNYVDNGMDLNVMNDRSIVIVTEDDIDERRPDVI